MYTDNDMKPIKLSVETKWYQASQLFKATKPLNIL